MTFVVTEACIRCKSMDCAGVCPVDCFYEGETMLVIRPDDCINCAVCVPACPLDAIMRDTDPGAADWIVINAKYSMVWPNITQKGTSPADADDWKGKPNKAALFSPNPGRGN